MGLGKSPPHLASHLRLTPAAAANWEVRAATQNQPLVKRVDMADYEVCPFCSARVELTPKRRQLKAHEANGGRCRGSGLRSSKHPKHGKRTWWSHLTRTAKILYSLIFSVVAGAVGILGWLGIQPSHPTPTIGRSAAQLVSSDSNGNPANLDSGRPSLDGSGRYVAFTSAASNLAPTVKTAEYNVYRKDRKSGETYLASGGAGGLAANGPSQFPMICANGRFIAFASEATNLVAGVPGITGSFFQVYVNDHSTGETQLVSVTTEGTAANGDSRAPAFSADCDKVIFESEATNLASGDTNGASDIFVRDLQARTTTLASANDAGEPLDEDSTHADINEAGTMVAFTSWASNIGGTVPGKPGIFVRNLQTHQTTAVSADFISLGPDVEGFSWPDFSGDGRYLVFRSITHALDPSYRGKHVIVWDLAKGESAIKKTDGSTPAGWNDACVTGVNNGTNFSPKISGATGRHSHRVLFTVDRSGVCKLVLRDLHGNDIPIRSEINYQQITEPTLNNSGDYLSWAVAGQPQLVYACKVDDCTQS